jgi:hypothetical protein
MKPIKFKYANKVYGEKQPEYQPLHVLKLDNPLGEVISCWKLTRWERIKVLFTGKVWLSLMTFNKPLLPSYLSVNRKEMYLTEYEKNKGEKVFRKQNKDKHEQN